MLSLPLRENCKEVNYRQRFILEIDSTRFGNIQYLSLLLEFVEFDEKDAIHAVKLIQTKTKWMSNSHHWLHFFMTRLTKDPFVFLVLLIDK